MNKIIKIDGENNFFIDINDNKVLKYDKKVVESLSLRFDNNSILTVNKDQIRFENGQVVFEFNNDRYIVDDGYQDLLIRAGYIVMDDYDVENIEDKDFGAKLRQIFLTKTKNICNKLYGSFDIKEIKVTNFKGIKVVFNKDGYQYTIYFDTINSIVNKNQQRKIDNLPFYPFLKGMDKYGTLYVSVFCKKISSDEEIYTLDKYNNGEKFITEFIRFINFEEENNYKFKKIIVKKKITHLEGV